MNRRGIVLRPVPQFRSDAEAARFWETHSVSDYWDDLQEAADVRFVRPRKQLVSLRLDRPLVQRVRALARRKGLPYSALIRVWLIERCLKAE